MKKLFFILFTLGAVFTFTACGSDDDEPIDYTLYDKSEIIGTQNGKVEISLSPGSFETFSNLDAKTNFVTSDNNNLSLWINNPTELGGPISASDFKKSTDDKQYTFSIANLTREIKKGGEIPSYVDSWFPNYKDVLNKIIIKDLKCTGARYDKATSTISFTYAGTLEVYVDDAVVASNTITYKFTELKK